jgi:membrane protein
MPSMEEFRVRLGSMLTAMARQAGELRLQQAAGSLTLLTLMAIVPTAAFGLLVLTALPAFESMRENVKRFVADNLFLPSFSVTVADYINEFAGAAEQLSAIGTVVFLATAMSAMLTIDGTLNSIWRTPRPRPLAQRLALYWSMLTAGPVLLGAALALQLRVVASLTGIPWILEAFAQVLAPLLGVLGLTLLYRMAPNERVLWRHALIGALVTGILLDMLRRLLGVYIAQFPSYTVVYGAFAALPLFLLWVFSIWMSVLVGALVASNMRFWATPLGSPHLTTPSGEFDRIVRVLAELVRAAPQRVPSARFMPDFDGDGAAADRVASLLAAQGYIVRVWPVAAHGGPSGVWDEYWLPTVELPGKTLRPIFERVWQGATTDAARRRAGAPREHLDPGSALLGRPLAEVLAARA